MSKSVIINKKSIGFVILLAWAVFALGYIAYDQYQDFKVNQLGRAYGQGQNDTVNQLIQRADKCEPFSIYSGDKEVNLISVSCLQQGQANQQEQQVEEESTE